MSGKLILHLSIGFALVVSAAAEDMPQVSEEVRNVVEECTAQENVTIEDIHKFGKGEMEATPEMKDFFLCVTQKLGTFDGANWNRDEIKRVVKDESRISEMEECLAKDDVTLEARERNFAVVSCCLKKRSFS